MCVHVTGKFGFDNKLVDAVIAMETSWLMAETDLWLVECVYQRDQLRQRL